MDDAEKLALGAVATFASRGVNGLADVIRTYGEQCRRAGAEEAVRDFAKAVAHGDDEHRRWLAEATEAFLAGQPLPPPRPLPSAAEAASPAAGWRLVPIEPTKEMLQAAHWAVDRWREKNASVQDPTPFATPAAKHACRWAAILAATPSPPTTERDARGGWQSVQPSGPLDHLTEIHRILGRDLDASDALDEIEDVITQALDLGRRVPPHASGPDNQ